MRHKPDAPAARRNREAILAVLQREFISSAKVLEIGSGTGQHAVYFGKRMPNLQWQTSDCAENIPGIESWLIESELTNVLPPVCLNVLKDDPPEGRFDAIFSANTAHIMSMEAVTHMFRIAGEVFRGGGIFCLYGPFNLDGEFTADSNRQFDRSLRVRDPAMGLRDLSELDELASANGLRRVRRYAMPSNNMISVWKI